MKQALAQIAILVKDYDEAIDYYTTKLGFELVEDTILTADKRWVVVSPKGASGAHILLAKASSEKQSSAIGNQSGGRVFLFLSTDDFYRDYYAYLEMGVKFVREPNKTPYGTVAVFEDLYGNQWDLLEHVPGHRYYLGD